MLVPGISKIGTPTAKPQRAKWKPGNLACGKQAQWRGPKITNKHEKYIPKKVLEETWAGFFLQ